MCNSEVVIFPALLSCLIILITTSVFVLQTKNDLDLIWLEFEKDISEVTVLRDSTWTDLKNLVSEKLPNLNQRTKRQSYYEKVADSYALPPSLAVEAQAPSISPECNCNLQNNCPAGPPGLKGLSGQDGVPGQDGAPGKAGPNSVDRQTMHIDPGCQYCPAGEMGPPGSPGKIGPRGQRGQNGASGTPGHNGMPGANGEQGQAGPTGAPGAAGTLGRRGMDTVREKGVRGPSGLPGPRGSIGEEGERGNRGRNGVDGPNGSVGLQGEPGRIGLIGSQGEQGEVGPNGQDALYCPCPKRVPVGGGGGTYQPYKQ